MNNLRPNPPFTTLLTTLLMLFIAVCVSGAMAQSRIDLTDSGNRDMTQIKAIREQVAVLKADLKQLEIEAQALRVRQQELTTNRPQPPSSRSEMARRERYRRALSEWMEKMTALNSQTADMSDRIEAKKKQLEQKQAELRELENRAR